MLTNSEKKGAEKLLSMLSNDDVDSLAKTVTKNLVTLVYRQETITAIIDYSQRAVELLRRKKIKRDQLFQYLARENVVVSPSAGKSSLIQSILHLWGSAPVDEAELMEVDDEQFPDENLLSTVTSTQTHNFNNAAVSSEMSASGDKDNSQKELQEMARVFAHWFYQMLNAYHPYSRESPSESFSQQHFYSGSVLKVLSFTPEKKLDVCEGASAIVDCLLSMVKQNLLKFNPNCHNEGLKGFANPHGLRVIEVCGTLHQGDNMVGLFKQQFGIARDPQMDNNWRIKCSNLLLTTEKTEGHTILNSDDPFFAIQ